MDFEKKYIDMHVHSNESDGTCTPAEVVRLAHEKQLTAIALTDHDTIAGLFEAHKEADRLGIELIDGIELSTDFNGTEVHILGYYIDAENETFLKQLEYFQDGRVHRNKKMARLLQERGFDISYEQLIEAFPDAVLTRAHFARYLYDKGYVKTMDQVFQKYIGNNCSCYVPREKITPFEAIDLIHAGGGKAYFAHPLLCHMNFDRLDNFIRLLKEHGLTGIEAEYSTYTPGDERNVKRFAEKYDLLISGGSDFHGSNKPYIQIGNGKGNLHIPYRYLADLKSIL